MENLKSMIDKKKNEEIAKLQWESWIVDLQNEEDEEVDTYDSESNFCDS